MNGFANDHLSFSRVQRFEQCPLSFKFHYIDKLPSEPGIELRFGKVIHSVLETLVREHVAAGDVAPLSVERALFLFRDTWAANGMTGINLFQEGLDILKAFVRGEGFVNPESLLAIEQPFEMHLGRFLVVGSMDRVDRTGPTSIRIRDYKTNRHIFKAVFHSS